MTAIYLPLRYPLQKQHFLSQKSKKMRSSSNIVKAEKMSNKYFEKEKFKIAKGKMIKTYF